MATPHRAQRTAALFATATLTLAGLSTAPAAFAVETASPQSFTSSESKTALSEGKLTWGIKESFRNYLATPLATGTWTFDKVEEEGGNFTWSSGQGSFDGTTGQLTFPGTLRVTAHRGQLDISISNIRLDIQGKQGTLIVDAVTKTMDGAVLTLPETDFATIDLSSLNRSETGLSAQDAPVTLTENGAKVFADMYRAGTTLDPLSFSAVSTTPAPESSEAPSEPKAEQSPESEATQTPEATPSTQAPSPTATPAPQETPSSAPSNAPAPTSAPAETGQALTPAAAREVTSGQLSWGIKDSFTSYITGPIARGSWNLSEGISHQGGVFTFSPASGAFDPETSTGEFKLPGALNFTGHAGKLDITLSDLRLQVADGKGYLVANVSSKKMDGGVYSGNNIRIAAVNTGSLKVGDNTVSLSNAAVALTASGAEAFAGFYPAGTVLAPLNLTAHLGEALKGEYRFDHLNRQDDAIAAPADGTPQSTTTAPVTQAADPAPETGQGAPAQAPSNSVASVLGSTSSPSSNPASTAAAVCVPVTVTETHTAAATKGQSTITAANLNWGLRSSFRNYIAGGIANGGWNLTGVSYASSTFNWSQGSGTFDQGKGSISFPGSINFYGHEGVLDITLSDIRIDIKDNQGTLYAHVVSSNMEGVKKNFGTVAFADLDLTGLSVTETAISVEKAPATLTVAGHEAFAEFYKAGETLDPLSFAGTITTGTIPGEVSTVNRVIYQGEGCSHLAHTGASSQLPLLLAGGTTLLAAGAVALLLARRNQA